MKYTTLIFDMDGTILDTLNDLMDATNLTMQKFGYNTRTKQEIRSFVGNGIKTLIEKSAGECISTEKMDEMFKYFMEYYSIHCMDKTVPYDGIINLLKEIKEKGYKTAVVTNKANLAANKLVDNLFPNLFDVVIGDQEGIRRKPYPDMVEKALELLHSNKKDSIYIGDSDVDFQTAINSNLPCISVLWGFKDKDYLKEIGASIFAETPNDILKIIT